MLFRSARNGEGFTAYSLATRGGHVNTALVILAAKNTAYASTLGLSVSAGQETVEAVVLRKSG